MQSLRSWTDSPLKWSTIDAFSNRARPLEIFIENKTVHVLKLDEDFIESGERVESTFKNVIDPESSWLTLVANKSRNVFPAVGGGLKYRLVGKEHILYLGFGNPFHGGHVSFACLSNVEHTAKWAYEEAKDGSFKSSEFGERRITAEMIDGRYCASKRIVFKLE